MNIDGVVRLVALIALAVSVWCACQIRRLQGESEGNFDRVSKRSLAGDPQAMSGADPDQRLKKLEAAAPSPGLFMAAIQMHFAKLYFAGEARNWDLAQFERGEILENLEVVAALRPAEGAVNLSGIMDAFKNTQLAALKDAIEMKDRGLFRDAYRESLQMCNACHQATGRPFIMIAMPTNPPVANQRWEPIGAGEK